VAPASVSAAPAESSFASILAASGSANAPSASASPKSAALNSSAEILKGRSVLVLDDEESLRQLLQEGLSAQGLRVDCAATAEEALARLQRSSYDILFCDLHLSANGFFVDGREAAARILAAAGTQKPAVVYMTGDLMESAPE